MQRRRQIHLIPLQISLGRLACCVSLARRARRQGATAREGAPRRVACGQPVTAVRVRALRLPQATRLSGNDEGDDRDEHDRPAEGAHG